MDRYARQRQLAGVGDGGQALIERARFLCSAPSGAPLTSAAGVERAYLERAGARHFDERARPEAVFAHAANFRHAAAQHFAAGAWLALLQLRRALEERAL
jgi:hypothetical protein